MIIRFFKNIDGTAAVEFSFVAPLLILLIVGLVDIGNYVRERMKLEQISRAAVDYVLQGGAEANITADIIAHYDEQNVQLYSLTTDRVCTCSDGVSQDCGAVSCGQNDHSRQYIEVSLQRTYSPLFTYPGIPNELTLTGNARMRFD